MKDDMHDARKNAGGGWEGIKSAASVIGKRIQNTDTYRKLGKQPLWKGNVLSWKQDENRSSGIKGEGGEFQSGTVACEEESRAGREESEETAETEKESPDFQ